MYRYGDEVARLAQAHAVVKKGYDIARKHSVAAAVLQDIKVCSTILIRPSRCD